MNNIHKILNKNWIKLRVKHITEIGENEQKPKRDFEILKIHSKIMRGAMYKASAVDLCRDAEHLIKKAKEVGVRTSTSTVRLLCFKFSPSSLNEAKKVVGSIRKYNSQTSKARLSSSSFSSTDSESD